MHVLAADTIGPDTQVTLGVVCLVALIVIGAVVRMLLQIWALKLKLHNPTLRMAAINKQRRRHLESGDEAGNEAVDEQ